MPYCYKILRMVNADDSMDGSIGTIGVVVRMSTLDTNVDGSILSINMFSP